MLKSLMVASVALAAGLAPVASGDVHSQPARAPSACFLSRDWEGWKSTKDAKAMYIRVQSRKIYRLDFAYACDEANWPDAHLVTIMRGSDWICSPMDIDLKISDGHGFTSPCMVRKITPLTSEEAAALPKSERP